MYPVIGPWFQESLERINMKTSSEFAAHVPEAGCQLRPFSAPLDPARAHDTPLSPSPGGERAGRPRRCPCPRTALGTPSPPEGFGPRPRCSQGRSGDHSLPLLPAPGARGGLSRRTLYRSRQSHAVQPLFYARSAWLGPQKLWGVIVLSGFGGTGETGCSKRRERPGGL